MAERRGRPTRNVSEAEQQGILAAILEHPDDDGGRWIYADSTLDIHRPSHLRPGQQTNGRVREKGMLFVPNKLKPGLDHLSGCLRLAWTPHGGGQLKS